MTRQTDRYVDREQGPAPRIPKVRREVIEAERRPEPSHEIEPDAIRLAPDHEPIPLAPAEASPNEIAEQSALR